MDTKTVIFSSRIKKYNYIVKAQFMNFYEPAVILLFLPMQVVSGSSWWASVMRNKHRRITRAKTIKE